jgi:hypothetical protein
MISSVLMFKLIEMKTTVLYAFMLIFSLCIQAQEFEIQFQKCYGGSNWEGASAILAKESEFIFFGGTTSNNGDISFNHGKSDYWLYETDSNGNIVWERTYGGSDEDYPANMLPTPDGGYVMFGDTYSNDGDVGCNHSSNGDWWLVKTDSLGNILWTRCYGGTHKETASQLIYANEGGYVMTGKTGSVDGDISHNNGQYDVWVVKVDWEGELVWERTFGGSRFDWANGIGLTTDGGYIIGAGTGSSNGDVNCFDSLPSDWSKAWVLKLDSEGQLQWQNCYGGYYSDVVVDILQTSDGGYVFLGQISSGDGDIDCFHGTPGNSNTQDMWVVKLDVTGEMEWNRCLGGSNFDVPRFIRPMDDGGYLIGGNTTSRNGDVNCNQSLPGTHTVILYKLTTQGEIEWTKCLGSQVDNSLFSIHIYSDYHFLLGATTRTNGIDVDCDLKGETDIWIVEIQDTTVGVQENDQAKLMLFPNPATTEAWLQLPAHIPLTDVQIELYNPKGSLLYKAQPESNFHKIETAQLPAGLYVVRLWDGRNWQSGRLVVR